MAKGFSKKTVTPKKTTPAAKKEAPKKKGC